MLNLHFYETKVCFSSSRYNPNASKSRLWPPPDSKVFEVVRVSHLLAKAQFVVSEDGTDSTVRCQLQRQSSEHSVTPEIQLESAFSGGVVFAPYDKLVSTVRWFFVALLNRSIMTIIDGWRLLCAAQVLEWMRRPEADRSRIADAGFTMLRQLNLSAALVGIGALGR